METTASHLSAAEARLDQPFQSPEAAQTRLVSVPATAPKTILLFGKTGDGKSTVGNMILDGDIEGSFEAGSSMSAVTRHTHADTNKDGSFTVIDTAGLYSPDQVGDDGRRGSELYDYFAENYGRIHALCYVKRATKFTKADEACWNCFTSLFKHHLENILLIFTDCREDEWLRSNNVAISNSMGAQFSNRVAVDFRPRERGSEEVEVFNKALRSESLRVLMEALQSIFQNAEPVALTALTGHSTGHLADVLKGKIVSVAKQCMCICRDGNDVSVLSSHLREL